jgi:UDP-N-acetylglucosamine 4,6-dehydratase
MTRFWITLDQGVDFVIRCIEQMHGGEVFVPKIPSVRMTDMAAAIAPGCKVQEIGIRPGEKLHEALISDDEARSTRELADMFVVEPMHPWWNKGRWSEGKPLPEGFRYASDTNTVWLTGEQLLALAASSA